MLYRYKNLKEIPTSVKVILAIDAILLIIAAPIFL